MEAQQQYEDIEKLDEKIMENLDHSLKEETTRNLENKENFHGTEKEQKLQLSLSKKQKQEQKQKNHEIKIRENKQKIDETGLILAFQNIFCEIIAKNICNEDIFHYVSKKLREYGNIYKLIEFQQRKNQQ